MPAPSRTADNMFSVSGASSIANITGFLGRSAIMSRQHIEGSAIAIQVTIFDEPSQGRHGRQRIGSRCANLIEFELDTTQMADLSQPVQ
jgi:hypothetical protein